MHVLLNIYIMILCMIIILCIIISLYIVYLMKFQENELFLVTLIKRYRNNARRDERAKTINIYNKS